MKLSTCICDYFAQYLPDIKGVSGQTVKSYRETFNLFLPFAARHRGIKVESLKLNHLSSDLVLNFLSHIEKDRHNTARTRNQRLAAIKSFARMIRLMYPEKQKAADRILNIPQKRTQRKLIGFFYQQEVMNIFKKVDIKKKEGFRDYTLLHLLYNSGARAGETALLNLDSFDPKEQTLVIHGKGDRYRLIRLWPKTIQLLNLYITGYRAEPKPLYRHRLFINQRKEGFTRHGIYRICRKHIRKALPPKRLKAINPAHSFRHSCAMNMLATGYSVSDIRNHLGHDNLQSTMIYLHMDLTRRKEVQKKFIEYTQSLLKHDDKIEELIDWENREEIMTWLDSL